MWKENLALQVYCNQAEYAVRRSVVLKHTR
jgi:hypothetical protein